MSSNLVVKKLDYPDGWEKLSSFFKEVYSPQHILTNKEFFEWQFQNSPGNPYIYTKENDIKKIGSANIVIVTEEKDKNDIDEVIGHLGLIPSLLKLPNGSLERANFLSCFILKSGFQDKGGVLIRHIPYADKWLIHQTRKNTYYREHPTILYTTGANDLMMNLLKALDWADAGNLYRWVKISNFGEEIPDADVVEIKEFDRLWDKSWKILQNRYLVTTNRSSEYLNWRFINHPKTKYKMFGIKDKEGYDGYIVLRLEEGEMRAVRIVDFIAKNEETEQKLLKAALNFASENKVDFLDFFCSSKIYAKSLNDLGFNDADNETPVFILPIDNTRKYINWAYKIINPEFPPKADQPQAENIKKEDWFIVKADGDKDRPQS